MRREKSGGARRTVFCKGFEAPRTPQVDAVLFFAMVFVPEVGAILFFTSILNHLPLPPARRRPVADPAPTRLVSPENPSSRVAGVRFVSKSRVLYESGNVF